MCLASSSNLLLVLQDAPKRIFPRTRDLLVSQKPTQRQFLTTLHPLSPVIFATATVVVLVLLRDSRFYTACSNAYSEIGPEVTPRPLATSCAKDYKGHSLVKTSFTEPPNRLVSTKTSVRLSSFFKSCGLWTLSSDCVPHN